MHFDHHGDILKVSYIFSHHRALVGLNLLLLAAGSFLTTYPINLLGRTIDIAAGRWPGGIRALFATGLLYCGCYLLNSIIQGLFGYYNQKLEALLGHTIRCAVFEHLMYLPYSFFDRINTGDMLVRLTEDSKITIAGFLKPLTFLARSSLTFGLGLYFMLRLEWRLTVIILLSGAFMTYFNYRTGPFLKEVSREQSEKTGGLWASFAEGIRGMRDIQVNGRQETFWAAVFTKSETVKDLTLREETIKTVTGTIYGAFYMSVFAGIATYGGWLTLQGTLGVGQLTAIMFYNSFLINPLLELNSLLQQWQRISVSLERIRGILEKPAEPVKNLSAGKLGKGDIVFDKVSFEYEPECPVLRQVNLAVPSAGKIAIVGASGAGKSTVLKLIAGIYPPREGKIRVGGLAVNADHIARIRNSVAFVFQDTFLFNGTLESNIRFANPDAGAAEVERAMKLAEMEGILAKLPQGPATEVGENGVKLSSGERQRIGLARALLRDPAILLLDEISSALDNITAARIFQNLKSHYAHCTLVMVAHRLHSIADVDCIYVMVDGKLAAQGTHRQLLESSGVYRSLWNAEAGFQPDGLLERGMSEPVPDEANCR